MVRTKPFPRRPSPLTRFACWSVALVLWAFASVFAAPMAHGQAADTAETPSPAAPADPPTATIGPGGLEIASGDGAFAVRLGGDLQVDGRFRTGEGPRARPSTFDLRRARLKVGATLNDRYRFRLMGNFASGRATLQDAYLDVRFHDAVRLRAGRFKMPVGLEVIQSANDLLLVERAAPTELVPQRDVGAVLYGRLGGGAVTYHAGVANGVASGTSGLSDVDGNKDLVARVYLEPIRGDARGLGVGAAATYGVHRGTAETPQLPAFRTVGGQTAFRYASDRAARIDGTVARFVPQTYLHVGPVGLQGEVALTAHDVTATILSGQRRDRRTQRFQHWAWQAGASVVVTGENATSGQVVPKRPFDPRRGQWGAVELAARVQQLRVDGDAFSGFADAATQAERLTAVGGGVSWYPDAALRVMANYVVTRTATPAGTDALPPERLLVVRLQIAF